MDCDAILLIMLTANTELDAGLLVQFLEPCIGTWNWSRELTDYNLLATSHEIQVPYY